MERKTYSLLSLIAETSYFALTLWDIKTHTRAHAPTHKHARMHTPATDNETIFGFTWYSIQRKVVGWDLCTWEPPILIKTTDIYTNTHTARCELPRKPTADRGLLYLGTINHNDRWLLAPCGIFGWAGSKRNICRGRGVAHCMLIITVTVDLSEEGHFTKAVKWHWSQHIEQFIKCLKLTTGVRVHGGDVFWPNLTNTLFDVWLKRHRRPNRSLDHHLQMTSG